MAEPSLAVGAAPMLSEGNADPTQPYWNMAVEPWLGSSQMRELQRSRMRANLKRLYSGSRLWRRWLDRHDVGPSDITSLEDFAKALPPFRKKDFRDMASGTDPDAVLADMITVPVDRVRLMAATSGTTGDPTPYPFTARDLALFCETNARVWWRAGVRPGDRVLQAFALGMFVAGVPIVMSNAMLGACVIPVGAEAGAERILKTAKLFKASVLNCTPSLAEHLIERAPEILGESIATLGITRLICGGEPGAGLPEVRSRIESAYGATLFDFGAGAGGSCGHPEYQGMHWVADDLMLYELVDPATDEPIALEDGAEGEACFTSLGDFDGLLSVRQSVGDIHRVEVSPCPCGKTGIRYRVVGRTDDMLKVKGVMVYPAAIDNLVASFTPRVTGAFRIVLDEPPPRVQPPLKLKVEYSAGLSEADVPVLQRDLVNEMHNQLRITPSIEMLPSDTLARSAHKTSFFERTYE